VGLSLFYFLKDNCTSFEFVIFELTCESISFLSGVVLRDFAFLLDMLAFLNIDVLDDFFVDNLWDLLNDLYYFGAWNFDNFSSSDFGNFFLILFDPVNFVVNMFYGYLNNGFLNLVHVDTLYLWYLLLDDNFFNNGNLDNLDLFDVVRLRYFLDNNFSWNYDLSLLVDWWRLDINILWRAFDILSRHLLDTFNNLLTIRLAILLLIVVVIVIRALQSIDLGFYALDLFFMGSVSA